MASHNLDLVSCSVTLFKLSFYSTVTITSNCKMHWSWLVDREVDHMSPYS